MCGYVEERYTNISYAHTCSIPMGLRILETLTAFKTECVTLYVYAERKPYKAPSIYIKYECIFRTLASYG